MTVIITVVSTSILAMSNYNQNFFKEDILASQTPQKVCLKRIKGRNENNIRTHKRKQKYKVKITNNQYQ
jgi:hypothetical protein